MSKWATPLDLYYQKRGEGDAVEVSIPMRCGTALEELVLELFTEQTGLAVTREQEVIFDKTHPWRWATVDGVTPEGELVEGKTTSIASDWGDGDEDIPIAYMMQVQHQLAVTGLLVCWVPVLIGNRDFRVYRIERDDELIEMLTEQEADFWQGVVEGNPPDPITADDVKKLYPSDDGSELLASEDVEALLLETRSLKVASKDLEELLTSKLDAIRALIGTHSRIVSTNGKVLATYKQSKSREKFDASSFKFDNPELHAQYIKETPGSRSLLIK